MTYGPRNDAGSRAPSSFTQPRFHQGLLRDLRTLGVCPRGPGRAAVFPPRVRLRELHRERRTTRRSASPLTSRVCSGGLGNRRKAPLPDPPASLSRLDSWLGDYPTGIPINRLSSRNRPTTKMPMNPRAIKVLALPGKCSHRSKSRSHHLSSPSPSRSSTMPPRRSRSPTAYRRECSTTSVLRRSSLPFEVHGLGTCRAVHDDDGVVGRWLVGPRARDVGLDPREVRSTSAGKMSASLNLVLNRRPTSYRTRSDLDHCAAVSEGNGCFCQ
jgi:hypothetical protein